MGNCFAFLKEYNTKPNIYSYNSNNIPVGTPIYFDTSNNNIHNPTNPNVIVINQQPYYYDNGLVSMNGFLTGMLIGELFNDDCL